MIMRPALCRYIKLILPAVLFTVLSYGQCPPNIGFETGSFDHWDCSIGSISNVDGSISLSASLPTAGRHTLFHNDGQLVLDRYGGFPVNCPNGSNYSIRLGNNSTGRQAEQVSYTFTIPDNQNNFSLIYHYAVVFQNPSHAVWEQPKFTANVFDVTTGKYIDCSSFSYAASSSLPGFKMSSDSVFYKPWTPVTIKLSGYASHTIRLEFTTNDCTRGGHFGYAYVDVNENCSSPISGNVQCATDTAQNLTAPFGFAGYRWFTGDFSKLLGTGGTYHFKPIPSAGSSYAVEVTPYPGQGCVDTVYTTIVYASDTISLVTPQAPIQSCVTSGVDLTSPQLVSGSSPGLTYEFYTDPDLLNYVSNAKYITQSGTYYIKAINAIGCTVSSPVTINVNTYPSFTVDTKTVIRPQTVDLNTLIMGNTTGISFSFWKDSLATIPLSNPESVANSGTYYIKGTNLGGCYLISKVTVKVDEPPISPPNAFSPNGDGIYDYWEIPKLSVFYPGCVVEIFNRLGQQVFRSVGYGTPWDGKYNGIDQPVGTYYYVIKRGGDLAVIGGSVTIVR